jgi:hypothetical protein
MFDKNFRVSVQYEDGKIGYESFFSSQKATGFVRRFNRLHPNGKATYIGYKPKLGKNEV